MNIFQKILTRLTRRRALVRPDDRGLFDPFLPITSLKRIENEFEAPYELADQRNDFRNTATGRTESMNFEENVELAPSFISFRIVTILAALVLATRLIGLQITQGAENFSQAEGNRLEAKATPAPRGLIFDRKGVALVRNEPSFSVVIRPGELPRSREERQEYFRKLSSVLSRDPSELEGQVAAAATKESLTLEDGINRDRALSLEIKLAGVSGVEIEKSPSRQYSGLAGLGHIIGYIGKVTADDLDKRPELLSTAYVGKTGIEQSYDEFLQGKPGTETLEIDALGRTIRPIGSSPPVAGKSLVLSLDADVQATTAQALREAIEKNGATSGAAVVMDVRSGDVLALVSFPTFDNNLFSANFSSAERQKILSDPAAPLINRAISGQYPSGSTIKPFVGAAALAEKTITADTVLDTSEGKIVVGQTTFSDWKTHGRTTIRQAIAESNNIFFFALGGGYKQINGLGIERLKNYLERFGFGSVTGIDLGTGSEAKGLVPTPDWKKRVKKESWFLGDTYNTSIGQGNLLVTPLQLTRATAAIANGGTLYQPRLVRTILGTGQQSSQEKSPVAQKQAIIDSGILRVIREGMRQTVQSGSARSFNVLPIEVAAKTGTAQTSKSKDKTHSWFTAFAPFGAPEIAVSVIVEGGGEGYTVAAPVARNSIERYFGLPLTPIVPAPPTDN
jgi:penicillin-binding protein 2